MSEQSIKPEKITKPIQLLGAWLAGLLSVDSCFLVAAANLQQGSFESIALTIAAIANVPLFLLAVFLLQTKFRPELQEDSYYSTYLSQRTSEPIKITKQEAKWLEVSHKINALEEKILAPEKEEQLPAGTLEGVKISINQYLPNFDEVKETLSRHGVLGFSKFGNRDLPTKKSIAISEYLPKALTAPILAIAKEAGFTHYTYFDNLAEETEAELLFGSYGPQNFEIN